MSSYRQPPYYYFGCRPLRLKIPLMQGNDIKVLQNLLKLLPASIIKEELRVDGIYDQRTRQAVKQFQRYFQLRSDGVVQQETFYYLGHRIGSYAYNEPIFSARLLGKSSRGPDVAVLQNRLAAYRGTRLNRPASSCFDLTTEEALRAFQGSFPELKADGIAGPELYDMLICWSPLGGRSLKKGRHGLDTCFLQYYLYQLFYHSKEPDGFFDQRTEKSLRQFQVDADITPDGIAGPKTFLALGTSLPFPDHRYYYRAARTDSLAQVANLFNKHPEDIIKANQISGPDFTIPPGKLLIIPSPLTFHLAEKGDTIESVAYKYAIPSGDLKQANARYPSTSLPPGEMLVLPRHQQNLSGSLLYLEESPTVKKLKQLNLTDFSTTSLLDLHESSPSHLSLTNDKKRIALLESKRPEYRVYDLGSGIIRTFKLPGITRQLSWSTDNHKLLADGQTIIAAANQASSFNFKGKMAQWLGDSQSLVYLQGKHSIRKINLDTGRDREILTLLDEDICGMQIDASGRQLIIFAQLAPARVVLSYHLDLVTGKLTEFSRNDYKASWSNQSELLLLLARDFYGEFYPWFFNRIHLYSCQFPLTELESLTAKSIDIYPGCFSPDDKYYLLALGVPVNFYNLPEQPRSLFIKRIDSPIITQLSSRQNLIDPFWIN